MYIEDSLIRFILHFGQEDLPLVERLIESFPMAVHTGFSDGLFFVLGGMEGRLARFVLSMAGHAVDIRHEHEAGRVRNPYPSYASIKLFGTHVGILAVAFIAIGRSMSNRRNLADLVLERRMTRGTFDFMIRHVFSVKRLRRIFCNKDFRFVMAFNAFSLRHMGIPLNHAEMTLLARNPSLDILSVIEIPTLDIDITFGCDVAGGATSDGAGNAVLFPLWTGFIVVADEAVDFMNRQVSSLNDLSVAGGAAELHTPS